MDSMHLSLGRRIGAQQVADRFPQHSPSSAEGTSANTFPVRTSGAHHRAECTRHPDPVLQGDPRIGQHLLEAGLHVVVLGIVALTMQLLQCRPVAFMQDEQGPVFEQLVDELVEKGGPGRR